MRHEEGDEEVRVKDCILLDPIMELPSTVKNAANQNVIQCSYVVDLHCDPVKQPPSLPEVRAKEERLPESSEVVIDPRGHVTQRPAARCQHVARGLKPSYAASARKVLMSSGRGLLRLQGSLGRGRSASPQSLYVNDQFPEAAPCPAQGCPLNPRTRVRLLPAACLRYILTLISLAS